MTKRQQTTLKNQIRKEVLANDDISEAMRVVFEDEIDKVIETAIEMTLAKSSAAA